MGNKRSHSIRPMLNREELGEQDALHRDAVAQQQRRGAGIAVGLVVTLGELDVAGLRRSACHPRRPRTTASPPWPGSTRPGSAGAPWSLVACWTAVLPASPGSKSSEQLAVPRVSTRTGSARPIGTTWKVAAKGSCTVLGCFQVCFPQNITFERGHDSRFDTTDQPVRS